METTGIGPAWVPLIKSPGAISLVPMRNPLVPAGWFLTRERGFTDTGANEFIPEYRSTIAYAQLYGTATVETQEEGDEGAQGHDDESAYPPRPARKTLRPGMKTYAIPVDAEHDAVIELPTPMTQARWENFKTFLTAMERIIVESPPDLED